MAAATETETVDLDEVEAQIARRLAELRERRQSLALDAVNDPKAVKELGAVEQRIAAANAELERVGLARDEHARREKEAAQAAAAERRSAALQRARELQAEREKLAAVIDSAARAFGDAIARWEPLCREQAAELLKAGSKNRAAAAQFRSWRLDVALRKALADAGVPRGTLELGPFSAVPLASLSDWISPPIEPLDAS